MHRWEVWEKDRVTLRIPPRLAVQLMIPERTLLLESRKNRQPQIPPLCFLRRL